MHIWIDIDNPKHIPFINALTNELKNGGHWLTITAQNTSAIKKALKEYNLNVKITGFVFSIFGLFSEKLIILRTTLLKEYIANRKIDIAFSLGSIPMLYTCATNKLPLILYIDEYKENEISNLPIALENCYFIVSENVQDKNLLEKGFDLNRVRKYKGLVKKEDSNPNPILIKEIVNKIEYFSTLIPGKVEA